ncbi:MAG: cobalamin biosynthesis protein CobD [Alphaproteobacteria bacterium]|nr:cobalamin biosynthesis protein CobD [Alphaproteobacteria bacterium]
MSAEPAPGALLLLLVALALDAALPERRPPFDRVPHPVRVVGAFVARLERRWNDARRSAAARRALGALCALVVVGGAGVSGLAVHALAAALPFGWLLELAAVVSLLAWSSLAAHVRRVALPLATGDLAGARAAVSAIVGRDTTALDEAGIARAAIESLAENLSDAVVAPALWYAAFGLPGLAAFKAASTLDSMIGHRSDRYLAFGWASARADDVANLVPARLTAGLIAAAAAPEGRVRAALATAWRDARRHLSPNAGWPEAAMAGALGLSLGGPRRYGRETVEGAWFGDGRRDARTDDIARALGVAGRAAALLGAAIALLWALT